MKYIVFEAQSTGESVAVLTTTYDERADAEAGYHTKLAFAAKSSVPLHTVELCTDNLAPIKIERYTHNIPPVAEAADEAVE